MNYVIIAILYFETFINAHANGSLPVFIMYVFSAVGPSSFNAYSQFPISSNRAIVSVPAISICSENLLYDCSYILWLESNRSAAALKKCRIRLRSFTMRSSSYNLKVCTE